MPCRLLVRLSRSALSVRLAEFVAVGCSVAVAVVIMRLAVVDLVSGVVGGSAAGRPVSPGIHSAPGRDRCCWSLWCARRRRHATRCGRFGESHRWQTAGCLRCCARRRVCAWSRSSLLVARLRSSTSACDSAWSTWSETLSEGNWRDWLRCLALAAQLRRDRHCWSLGCARRRLHSTRRRRFGLSDRRQAARLLADRARS